ncbi:MAG TPA: hypothetical protein VE621_16865 [Bryobacteraceae bacterium]|nr:hypothetical protein [Bryobacteraceae bacterium]
MGGCVVCWLFGWRTAERESSARTVVGFALLFRLCGFFGAPIYEDDWNRYLWDGRTMATTGNPYGKAPEQWFGEELPEPFDDVLGRINFPGIPTIYGPVCQFSFLLAYWMAPGRLWSLKLVYLLADLALMVLVWNRTRSPAKLLLYSWCPLVIKEVAFTAHTDVLAALFLTAAVLMAERYAISSGLLFGTAIASKISMVAFAPLLLVQGKYLRAGLGVMAALTLWYAPFLLTGATERDGLQAFASHWEFNSTGYWVLQKLFGDLGGVAAGVLFLGFVAFALFKKRQWLRPDVLVAVFFVLAPVVNPWYLLVLAPLVALQPSTWGMAALSSVLLSYATFGNLQLAGQGLFDHPWWVRLLECLVIVAAIAWDNRRRGA